MPKTGGMASPLQPEVPGAALAAPGRSTTVESNHASPPYQSGAFPAGPSSMFPRSSESASAVSQRGNPLKPVASATGSRRQDRLPSRRRQGIAPCSPGSHPGGSLLAVRRSLAGRIRTPVPHGRSVVLTTELRRERNALDGSRTRLARQTTGSRLQTRPRACCDAVPRAGIEPALPV